MYNLSQIKLHITQFHKNGYDISCKYVCFWKDIITKFIKKQYQGTINFDYFKKININEEEILELIEVLKDTEIVAPDDLYIVEYLKQNIMPSRYLIHLFVNELYVKYKNEDAKKLIDNFNSIIFTTIYNTVEKDIKYIVNSFHNKTLDDEDKLQLAYIGLLEGIYRYDFNTDYSLTTYLSYWVRHSIRKGIFETKYLVHVPRAILLESFKNNVENFCVVKSLYSKVAADSETYFIDIFCDDSQNMDTVIDKLSWQTIIEKIKQKLSKMDYDIFVNYFGINGKEYTYSELGKLYGYTAEGIRRRLNKSLNIIKKDKYLLELLECVRC